MESQLEDCRCHRMEWQSATVRLEWRKSIGLPQAGAGTDCGRGRRDPGIPGPRLSPDPAGAVTGP